ncbi:MAG: tetratricopeptide repeat protein, partial [Actinobacteria bacterium]|nr:tetratricopeptide repeat protein [Actinomycetota bacterium]
DWAQPEITRLEELRLAATEERIELQMAAGRHADLVGELEALVAQHPLRERFHGQLMLALYRSGRQAEALAAYQRARGLLTEQLGLDPSTALRELEQAILRQDQNLGAPIRTDAAVSSNVPTRLTSFIGRQRELQQVGALVGDHRLVTLTGPGGVGKTTLVIEAAARLIDQYPDGVWLVPLASVSDPALVGRTVAATLGAPEETGTTPDHLARYLRGRHALVVLDNCEHLADACAALAEQLLGLCPQLRLLTTSREPLAVPGEVQVPIPPLDTPPEHATPADLAAYDAVRLFLDRARSALPGFQLDDTEVRHVAQLCRRLDGIPLAIELAAARVKTLPVSAIAARLDDRFRLLSTGPRTVDKRQQTLRGTVDWSHQLLTTAERVLFRRLSVFAGGWSLESAEEVCPGDGISRSEILELLARLVDRSLVIADPGGQGRFHLLETLRHYAHERLVDVGEQQWLTAAHALHFTAVAERGETQLRGPAQGRWLRWLQQERDNLQAAWEWARDHTRSEPDLGVRLAAALGWFWYFASRQDAGLQIAAMLTAADQPSPAVCARALQAQSLAGRPGACVVHPSAACAAAARNSLVIFTTLRDGHRAAYSQTFLAVEGIGGTEIAGSLQLLADAAEEFTRANDQWGQALVCFVQMELHFTQGAFEEATRDSQRALAIFRRLGDHWGVSAIQYHLGMALHRAGRLGSALEAYQGAVAEGRTGGLANTVQYALAHSGHARLLLGETDRAARDFTEAHQVARELGTEGNPLAALGQGHLARHRGDLACAQHHYTQALHLLDGQDKPDWTAAALTGLGHLAELTGDLGTAHSYHHRAWHTATRAAATNAAPTALEGLACLAAARGEGHTAAKLLGAASRWRDQHGVPASTLELHDITRAATRALALLGKQGYQAAHRTALPLDEVHLPT